MCELREAGALVLFRPCHLLLEDVGGTKRAIGIAEQLPSQQDNVRLPSADDVLSLLRRGDHSNGSSQYVRLTPHALSKWSLISRAQRNFRRRNDTSRRTVDEIDAQWLNLPG